MERRCVSLGAGIGAIEDLNIKKFLKYVLAAVGTTGLAKAPAVAVRKRRLKAFLCSDSKHTFPTSTNPRISFVIPVYNGAHHTLECLLSILRMADGNCEVIIIDDGCADETTTLLSHFENIRVHRNAQNLGFLRSINAGAKIALGEYLVLINNDARLVEGSLTAALDVYESEKNCGLMGARVRHVSGGLQEAGCVIYQNGTTNGYLRYQPQDDLRAMFQRDVDYCSGVFAIIARQHFEALGGLDESYSPAYFEETDFCMRLRERGLRCIYNPRLLIDHFEFGSSANAKAARLMIEERRSLFLTRWGETLRGQNFLPQENAATVESAALRLLPHPRRLIIVNAKEAASMEIENFDKDAGHVTFYVLDGTPTLMKRLVVKTNMNVALAFGNQGRLRGLMKQRLGVYDAIDSLGEVDTNLIVELRKKSVVGSRKRT